MKPSFRNPLLRNFVLAATSLLGFSSLAYSADLYWDANGETAGVGGTGNWSATAWRDGSPTGTLGNWADGNTAVFATTLGIVTLDQNVAATGMSLTVNNSEIRGSGTNAITFSGGSITSGNSGHDITALLAGSVIFNPTAGSLAGATTFNVKANNTGLTSVQLNATGATPANANMIIDDAGAFGPGGVSPSTVTLTAGILNIGALTNEVIGVANGSGGGINLNAWTTTLAGGTIRSRAGANTWNGPTTLTANSGLMTRGASDVVLTFSNTATINLGAFTLTCSSDLTAGGIRLQGNITGAGKIATGNFAGGGSINAAGSTILSGTNNYSGGTDIAFGSLVFLTAASKPATGTVTAAAGTTLGLGVGSSPTYFTSTEIDALLAGTLTNVTLNATSNVGIDTTAGDFIYAGTTTSSVTYGLAKLGANKLTLTGSNAYTGPTTIFGGSLALSGAGTFGSGALTLNGGVLDLGGNSVNIGALSVVRAAPSGVTITAGSLTTSATTATAYAASNTTGNAVIAANLLANGTAGFTKTGAGGTVSLSGANTYTGGTTVTTGTLTFLNTAAKPATGTTTPAAAATLGLGVGASPTYFTAADVASLLAGTLTNVAGTNAYTVGVDTSAGDFSYTADLVASTRALTKLGANSLTLSGNNTYDKLITVNEGTLKAGSATAFNNTGTLAVVSGATFDLNGFDAKLISMTSTTGTITNTGAGSATDTLTLSASNVDGIANLFTDNGTRKLKLDLTSATSPAAARQATTNANNTYSGGIVLGNAMRAQVPAGTVGTPGAIVNGPFGRGTITVAGGATNTNGAQIWFAGANRTIMNDIVVNGNAGNGSRAGTFRLNVTGCVISGNIDANGTDAWFGSDGTTTLLLSGKLTGAKGFRFFNSNGTSPFTITLNNATPNPSDYLGNTIVDSSSNTLVLGAANQIPNGPGKGNVAVNFGKLDLAGYSETINGLSGGASASVDNLTAANPTNTLTLGDGDAPGTFSGVIANTTGELSIVKNGSGTQTFAGGNTYSGTTTVNGGTLLINGLQDLAAGAVQVNTATLGGSGTIGGAVTVASGGTITPGTDGTVESLDIADTTILAGTFACDVDAATTDQLFVGGDLNLTGSTLDINVINPGTSGTYVIASYTGNRIGTLGGTLPAGYSLNYDDTNKEIELIVVGSPYDTWIAGYPSITGLNALPTADPDNDGLVNQQEFAFGLVPNDGSSVNPILIPLNKTNGQFTYQRLAASGLTYTIWTSPDLSTWTPDGAASESPTTVGANQNVVVTLSATPKPLTATKLFVRVQAN